MRLRVPARLPFVPVWVADMATAMGHQATPEAEGEKEKARRRAVFLTWERSGAAVVQLAFEAHKRQNERFCPELGLQLSSHLARCADELPDGERVTVCSLDDLGAEVQPLRALRWSFLSAVMVANRAELLWLWALAGDGVLPDDRRGRSFWFGNVSRFATASSALVMFAGLSDLAFLRVLKRTGWPALDQPPATVDAPHAAAVFSQ